MTARAQKLLNHTEQGYSICAREQCDTPSPLHPPAMSLELAITVVFIPVTPPLNSASEDFQDFTDGKRFKK